MKWSLRLVALALVGVLLAGGCGGGGGGDSPPNFLTVLQALFCQLHFDLGPFQEANSAWGGLEVSFAEPNHGHGFLNLVASDQWVVKNLPIPFGPDATPGSPQRVFVPFPLFVNPGTQVNQVLADLRLSDKPLTSVPNAPAFFPVGPWTERFQTGEIGFQPLPGPAAPFLTILLGGILDVAVQPAGFPNQDCGANECAPAAISNSLQWLNATRALGLAAGLLDIAAAKGLTGWAPGGAPAGANPWWDRKDAATTGGAYGLNTDIVAQDGTVADRIADFDAMIQAIKDGKDVEIRIPGHVACVVGALKYRDADGNIQYVLLISHDTDQGNAGGTRTEVVHYDPATNTFTGGWLFDGAQHDRFVIEYP
jgi:hypothetical protein